MTSTSDLPRAGSDPATAGRHELPPSAALAGPGTITALGGALLLTTGSPTREALAAVGVAGEAAVAGEDAAAVLARLQAVDAPPGTAAVVPAAGGVAVVAGQATAVQAEQVVHRTVLAGPVAEVLPGAVRVVVRRTDPDEGLTLVDAWAVDVAPTARGTRSGGGVVLEPEGAIGRPGPSVPGVWCACGGFGHPLAVRCPRCGRLLDGVRQAVEQPGVPVGRLVLDDGRVVALAGTVVAGRDPRSILDTGGSTTTDGLPTAADPAVAALREGAGALVLPDTQRSVSRAHAVLAVDGWDLLVRDCGRTNGTAVRPASAGEWTALDPGAVVRVLPGTEIRLGRRTIRFLA